MMGNRPLPPLDVPIDIPVITRTVELLETLSALIEIRIPQTVYGTVSGYFGGVHNIAEIVDAVRVWNGRAAGVYVTLNPVSGAVWDRSWKAMTEQPGRTTSDAEIIRRRWLPIDFDPVRPAKVSSTDAEHEAALNRARECRGWLLHGGWPAEALVLADSGNGAHLLARIELPNDEAAKALTNGCLKALAGQFSDRAVKVDTGVGNAARIWKLYGTLAAKGPDTTERPHRLAKLLEVPEELTVVPTALLDALAQSAATVSRRVITPTRASERHGEYPRRSVAEGTGGQQILAGERNTRLTSLAGTMRRRGMGEAAILAALRETNATDCDVPLDETEVEGIARSIGQYEPGDDPPDELDRARVIVGGLPERAKTDTAVPFEPETLGALALVQQAEPAVFERTRAQLKVSGVRVLMLDQAVENHKKQRKRHLRLVQPGEAALRPTAGQMLADAPLPDLVVPEPYALRPTATIQTVRADGAVSEREIAFAPILIAGRLCDEEENVESLRLTYRRGGRWHDLTVNRGVALDGKKLVDTASAGFPVAGDNAKPLAQYLHVLEAVNHDRLPCERVSSHLGWQGHGGDAGFLWGRQHLAPVGWTEAPIAFHGLDAGDTQIAAAYRAAGTLAGWLDAVAVLGNYPRVLLALYAAFVPPLLAILNAPNFVVDWSNRTSTGKTTALRVAASVWGTPDERTAESALGTWDATRVWVERASAVLSGIPLLLDDTSRAKYPKIVADLLYTVASGHGRGRGNKLSLDRTRTWRTVMLSTGEAPATSFTQDGGTRMRCLEVRGVPFERTDTATHQLVDRLAQQLPAHYGHAGPAFVRWLLTERAQWPALEAKYRAAIEYYATQNGRLAQYMAAIHTAADVVHRVFNLPWCYGDKLAALWPSIAAEAADASGEERALRSVMSWAHANRDAFYHGELGQGTPPYSGWAGRWDQAPDWEYVAFYPHQLHQLLRDDGYTPEAIIAAWKERQWLDTDHDRNRSTKRIRVAGERPHMIVITREAIDAIEA